ncbi:MAG: polysaccharide export protein [Desulfohalobiaceae bacterium]|nr:polysaccharide export protein [Desulfohalobiaceae bacterium]
MKTLRRRMIYILVACCFVVGLNSLGLAEKNTKEASVQEDGQYEEYLIGKGDVLEVNVWKEPELTAETFVRIDGRISMRLIGDVQAAGKTPMELSATVEEKLSEYVEMPVVTVIIKAQGSYQFYIIGEVASAGAYPLEKRLTIIQAIAQVGGFTEWADKDDIVLLRHTAGREERIEVDIDDLIEGKPTAKNIVLKRDDTLIVP